MLLFGYSVVQAASASESSSPTTTETSSVNVYRRRLLEDDPTGPLAKPDVPGNIYPAPVEAKSTADVASTATTAPAAEVSTMSVSKKAGATPGHFGGGGGGYHPGIELAW